MAVPVIAQTKLTSTYAERLRLEAASRRMSMAALVTDYAMRGMDAAAHDKNELAGFERRITATILAMRSDQEALQAELDTVAAMLDVFVKLMLVHLPEPGSEKEATQASALARYERFIQQTANAFDGDRPQAMKKIGYLIQQRIETAPENQ